ncbi:GATOR complex protein mio [Brevipalpus obovatus]|uniref:GATOR complex protein mio n=1 Tax=Brevipalpus obovatus TaxID=246614 RepID=UPI003D9EA708
MNHLTNKGEPKVTLNWSPSSEIIWTNGEKFFQCLDSRDNYYKSIEDVSVKMRERAKQNYGLDLNCVPDDPKLRSLWNWISAAKKYSEENASEHSEHWQLNKLVGINGILFGSNNLNNSDDTIISRKSDVNYAKWIDLSINVKVPMYISEERRSCLDLCGWGSNIDALIATLLSRNEFIRAAAIALFNLRMRKAIKCLKEGANASIDAGGDPNLSSIAMALSGYTGERNSLWREVCTSLRYDMKKPYLRAIFTFLASDPDQYEEILKDKSLELADRVAFACAYLPDKELKGFIDSSTSSLIENGSIDGLLLTGVSNEGLDLLQRYVEATSDIQSVSFVILHALPDPLCKDPRALLWVENYRNILDCWRLWQKRALFDNLWYEKVKYRETPEPQLFVTCNFCGKSISPAHRTSSFDRPSKQPNLDLHPNRKISISTPQDVRIQSCPNCRKPLPRCCICLAQFGTPVGSTWRKDETNPVSGTNNSLAPGSRIADDDGTPKKKMSPLSTWFSWCQTCRHGGHAKHILDWFSENSECPVSGCSCRCILLDNN